jgi:hypothetical protein
MLTGYHRRFLIVGLFEYFDHSGTVTLTGYLENCSITGCPAIQH